VTRQFGSILLAIGYLGVLVFIIWFCAEQSSGFDEFSKYWGLFGTIVGVTTGAIPAFFFKQQVDAANDQAASAQANAEKATVKAELYAAALEPTMAREIQSQNPHLF